MTLPIQGNAMLLLGLLFGAVFGLLLHRGKVANYDVIVNQFRLKDFTVLKVMFSAILVGGIGVWILHGQGLAQYHIKSADMLGVTLGAAVFGVGMVVYGYCPGTGIAAVGSGSIHAAVGFLGMLAGGIFYALTFSWVKTNVLSVASLGKVRLSEISGVHEAIWFLILIVIAMGLFAAIQRSEKRSI